MKKKRRVKIILRHSSPLLKCVLLAAIVFGAVALLVLKSAVTRQEIEYNELRKKAAQEETRRSRLQQNMENHGTVEGIKRYAEEVLGLVDPDTVFFETTP